MTTIWSTELELSTRFKGMKRLQNVDEGVLPNLVRDVLHDGAGPVKRERLVFKGKSVAERDP